MHTEPKILRTVLEVCPVLRLFSSKQKLLDEVPVVDVVQTVFQKSSQESKIHSFKDLMPLYLVTSAEGKNTLLIREKATKKQLAFKFILAKAFEVENAEAIDTLFNHRIFNTFGENTKKLFNEVYKEKKYIKSDENLSKNQQKWFDENSDLFCKKLSKIPRLLLFSF